MHEKGIESEVKGLQLILSYSEFTDSKMPSCQGSTAGSSCEAPEWAEKWQNSFSVDEVMHLGKKK